MKIAQKARKYMVSLGIGPDGDRLNQKILLTTSIYSLSNILLFVFLVHDAKSFREYIDSIYTISATILVLLSFINVVNQRVKIFKTIEIFENLIEMSK